MLIEDKDRNDNEVVRKLIAEAEKYSLAEHGNERLECYLLLSNMTSLWVAFVEFLHTVSLTIQKNIWASIPINRR